MEGKLPACSSPTWPRQGETPTERVSKLTNLCMGCLSHVAQILFCSNIPDLCRNSYRFVESVTIWPQKVQFGTLAISWKGIPNWGRSFYLTSPFRHCKSSSDNNCQVLLRLETMKSPIPGNIESKTYLDFYSFIYPVHLWTRQKRGVGEQNYDTVLSCK